MYIKNKDTFWNFLMQFTWVFLFFMCINIKASSLEINRFSLVPQDIILLILKKLNPHVQTYPIFISYCNSYKLEEKEWATAIHACACANKQLYIIVKKHLASLVQYLFNHWKKGLFCEKKEIAFRPLGLLLSILNPKDNNLKNMYEIIKNINKIIWYSRLRVQLLSNKYTFEEKPYSFVYEKSTQPSNNVHTLSCKDETTTLWQYVAANQIKEAKKNLWKAEKYTIARKLFLNFINIEAVIENTYPLLENLCGYFCYIPLCISSKNNFPVLKTIELTHCSSMRDQLMYIDLRDSLIKNIYFTGIKGHVFLPKKVKNLKIHNNKSEGNCLPLFNQCEKIKKFSTNGNDLYLRNICTQDIFKNIKINTFLFTAQVGNYPLDLTLLKDSSIKKIEIYAHNKAIITKFSTYNVK